MNPFSGLKLKNHLPAGQTGPMGTTSLVLGLFGAPLAWMVQIALSEPLAAKACYPRKAPLPAPSWEGWSVILTGLSMVCLALALLSGLLAWTSWRRQAREPVIVDRDESARLLRGRLRFLIKLGLMSSFIFIVAVVFNTLAVLLVPLCSSWY